jgi:hypothetical protein
MKTTKLMICALCAAVWAAFSLVGCSKMDLYSINSPSDLQHRIDSIANAKPKTGDTTYLTIATTIVGNEDNSSAWWTAFTDYFGIPTNKLLHLEFINHTSGANNWNNWNLAVANKPNRAAADYKEYFVLRSDAYGWGGKMANVDPNYAFDLKLITQNYPDLNGNGDIWDDFRTTMQGAYVTMDIDHSATGNVFVTATAKGTNGTTLVETYHQPVSALDSIAAFLVCDGSHFEMKKAYLIPSKVTVIADVNPVSISIDGAPASVELGNKNFWGNAKATVTFADGSSKQVDTTDLSFNVIPDMTTLGSKTVVVAYSKTKQGAYCKAVSTFYTLEVTSPIVSIKASNINYYYFNSDSIIFKPVGIVVTATHSDGSTIILDNSTLSMEFPKKISPASGSQIINISYAGKAKTFTTTSTVTLIQGVSQVGNTDFSSAWWTAFSADYTVASGASKTFTMYCYSDNVSNWHSPCTILRKADKTEYGVVRMDNFGWGTGYSSATLTSDWNWNVFTSSISGSKIVITVTNNGNNTADVLYNVTYANGETHFQKYAGVTVDSADLNCAFVTEESYLVFTN